jgi:hypothetical protein
MQSWEPFAIFLFDMICNVSKLKQALDNTEGAINNGQSRETGNVEEKQSKSTIQHALATTVRKQT